MNDGTSGTHPDDEALEAERRPDAQEVDTGGDAPFPMDQRSPEAKNIDESVRRAAW